MKILFEWISKHWIVITAAFTILTSSIGVFSSSVYYSNFNIDYIELAEFNDFVKDGLFRPEIALVSFLFILITLNVLLTLSRGLATIVVNKNKYLNYRVKKRKIFRNILSVLALFGSVLFILISQPNIYELESNYVKSDRATLYNITTEKLNLNCVSFIGRINLYHIFWNSQSGESIAIPAPSIKTIIPKVKLEYITQPRTDVVLVIADEYQQWKESVHNKCGERFQIDRILQSKKLVVESDAHKLPTQPDHSN